jgi:hypothetical protein
MAILNKKSIPLSELTGEYLKGIISKIYDNKCMDSITIPITPNNNFEFRYIEDQLESHLKLMDGFTFSDLPKLI